MVHARLIKEMEREIDNLKATVVEGRKIRNKQKREIEYLKLERSGWIKVRGNFGMFPC